MMMMMVMMTVLMMMMMTMRLYSKALIGLPLGVHNDDDGNDDGYNDDDCLIVL